MKYFILTTLLLTTVFSNNLTAQKISSDVYNKDYIHEDFNKESKTFKLVTTSDNYFILDKGDYLLSRNNNESEYAIIASNSNVSDFVLKTNIRIGPSDNKKASLGIILKAQNDGKGAIIFEINKQGEYRIKQLVGSAYQTLSGNSKDEGWVESNLVNRIDEHNFIEIRSEKNIYDVYINNSYLTTFFVPDFSSGSCGLIISPKTKARVSYFYINIKGENTLVSNYTIESDKSSNSTIEKLNKKIEQLENNNAKLNVLNKESQTENKNIAKLHQINIKHKSDLESKEQKIQELNQRVNSKKNEITELNKKNINLASVTLEQEKKIKSIQKSAEDLRVAENKVAAKNKQLNKEVSSLQQQITLEKTATSEIKNNLDNLDQSSKTTITQLNNEIKELNQSSKSTITQLNKEIKKLESKSSTLTKNKNTLETDLSLTKAENFKLTNDLTNLNKSSESSITQLNNKVTELDIKIKTLNKKINRLETNLTSVKNTHEETKSSLSKSLLNEKTETEKLSSELVKSNNELTILMSTQAKHNDVTKDLNTKITDLSDRITLLTNYLNTANDKNKDLQNTNNELKELFIIKDFEVNGVKPSEMVKESLNTPKIPKVLEGNKTIYSVQFGVYMQEQSYSSIKEINNVWYKTTEQGAYIYYSGEFNLPQEAAAHMNNLISKGYSNAFVVTITK